ncbi:MAG: DUF1385 domain-containing protein [Clostridia bacterium]|nr:DUF1385 domain-containing protein [Clostridia bacterium]
MARRRYEQISASPVAEGVRFRIGTVTAFAVRRENKDVALRIRRERRPMRSMLSRMPFVRGIHRLITSVGDLIDGIGESAELQPQRIARGSALTQGIARLFRARPEGLVALGTAFMIPFLLLGLIYVLPLAVETFILPNLELTRPQVNAVICAVRTFGALLAVGLSARLRLMDRLCMYRGAINKVMNAYESKPHQVTQDTAAKASRVYRKSDAAFLTVVLLVSIVAFALIRTFTLPVQILVRVLVVFVVAAVVNEPIRALENTRARNPLRVLLIPYLWLERMFVIEPHSQMIEVAVYAFNAARENDD